MADWAPILVGLLLFILLSPGLLFTTNVKVIVVHTIIFFVVFTILILAVGIHIYVFIILIPNKLVEFGNMETSGASIVVHAAIYFGLIAVFLIAIGVHVYTDH
ncbi:hypothetical protein K2173_027629 [Erythroxylum novogranatense]|uniref:Uncharacterized protein n=1 Tax=Erythroxylum novogranatense TaxID=1862640 RepID=A0AAV8TZJ9_9ROSI|nr:hypothetical protein K2173_027629 [Erythroxylum novogranatense]